ncbi:dehydrogenase [Bacillus sp. J14TS2]|uniref:Gfo/Idh/MocA family protein n=1 Tax=Bacillus sp. J14TS2 TaxID=2807188 RepID=UPI001B1A5E3A|nr:Gfo/Idh/MocA family oxidoreductase [Bacillus sp. J14TS2]GIN70887.1 dehydrogenase [Bacillus sp. J14TS2]
MSAIKIGMIGLDTSHVIAFTKLLNDPNNDFHVPGGEVVVAYPGGSSDMELSYNRVEGFTRELRDGYGIEMVHTPEEVAEKCDAILLESVDGRVHLEQFRKIVSFKKPTFIDKPFATTTEEAKEIQRLAKQYQTPIMSCSALRYAAGLSAVLEKADLINRIGMDCYGPLAIEPHHGLFWYGIHTVEMLYRVFGSGCQKVTVATSTDHDLIIGEWADGRIGSVRGNRKGNHSFGALIHTEEGTDFVDVSAYKKPYYATLLEQIISFFNTGKSPIQYEEILEITRFLEAANESRSTGKTVNL